MNDLQTIHRETVSQRFVPPSQHTVEHTVSRTQAGLVGGSKPSTARVRLLGLALIHLVVICEWPWVEAQHPTP